MSDAGATSLGRSDLQLYAYVTHVVDASVPAHSFTATRSQILYRSS